jgi:hypothetical protein
MTPARVRPQEIVTGVYRALLSRAPEAAGLQHQLEALGAGSAELGDVIHHIRISQEATEQAQRAASGREIGRRLWDSSAEHRGERQIYVLHTMKTGGTALLNGLQRIAGSRLCLTQIFLDHVPFLPSRLLAGAALVAGHLGFDVIDRLSPDVLSCTVVREPVSRVLSHYAHVRRDPALVHLTAELSLEDFIFDPRWRPLTENFQARHLVHTAELSRAWVEFSPPERLRSMGEPFPTDDALPLQFLLDYSPLPLRGKDLEDTALARLDQIELVGINEDVTRLFRALAGLWGVSDAPPLTRDNVGTGTLESTAVPPELHDAITEANRVDQAVYERAVERSASLRP